MADFGFLATIVRNDMLGLELTRDQQRTLEAIYAKGAAKGQAVEDYEVALDALAYLLLHLAKCNAVTEELYESVFEQSGLKKAFKGVLYEVMKSSIKEIRDLLLEENERGTLHFKDIDWRLNMVTACRQRQRMFLPKYTMHLHLEKKAESASSEHTLQDLVLDLDYTNMKRL